MDHPIEHPIKSPVIAAPSVPGLRPTRQRLSLLRKSPAAMIGTVILAVWIIIAIFGAQIAPYDINASESGAVWKPPSGNHLMGTDALGRDIFSRLLIAAQPMMLLPLLSVGAAMLLGSAIGLFTGYRGGWLDEIVMRFM